MQTGIQIGPLTIHFYGVIIMLGALAATWLSAVEARRRKINHEIVWDLLPWLLIGGIIGARLWHVFTPPASMVAVGRTTAFYFSHPLEILKIWEGGLGIPGAVMGGALALYIYSRVKSMSFVTWVDIIAPGLALAPLDWPWLRRLAAGATLSIRRFTARLPTFPGRSISTRLTACRNSSMFHATTPYSCTSRSTTF